MEVCSGGAEATRSLAPGDTLKIALRGQLQSGRPLVVYYDTP